MVDFLFSLLDLPLATAVSLVGMAFVAGSAGSLYSSADLEARLRHSAYARPFSSSPAASLFLVPTSSFEPSRIFFRCKSNNAGHSRVGIRIQHCCLYKTDVAGTRCPNCCNPMTEKLQHVSSVYSSAWSADSEPTFSSSPAAGADGSLLLKPPPSSSLGPSRIYFRCEPQYSACRVRGGCNLYMADVKGTACPNCDTPMTETLYYVSPAWPGRTHPAHGAAESVQDQEVATYTVWDNLSIMRNDPTSPISTVTRLGRMGITDLALFGQPAVIFSHINSASATSHLPASSIFLSQ